MKKRHILILGILMLMLSISSVNANLFDDFFSEENSAYFIDMGIEGNSSSDWHFLNNVKVSVTDKGTVLVNKGEGNAFYTVNKPSTSMDNLDDLIEWNAPYTVEFDLVSDNGSAILITDNVNSTSRTFEQLGVSNNSHVKLVNDGAAVKYYINGVSDPVYTFNEKPIDPSAIRFVIPQNGSLTYKNFTIY